MQDKISKEVQDEVKKLLPKMREQVLKEFEHWDMYHANKHFHSDEKVLEILPCSAYEYIILSWGIEPERVTTTSVVQALNNKLFNDLKHIICHTLRRLALAHDKPDKTAN